MEFAWLCVFLRLFQIWLLKKYCKMWGLLAPYTTGHAGWDVARAPQAKSNWLFIFQVPQPLSSVTAPKDAYSSSICCFSSVFEQFSSLKILKALCSSEDNKQKYQSGFFPSLCVALLLFLSPRCCDAKPRIRLPDHCGHAANPHPHSHWQPAKQYGQPDARHDGPVPASTVLSGNSNNEVMRWKQILHELCGRNIFSFVCFFCSRFLYHNRRTSSQCWCPVSQDREQWLLLGCSPAMVFSLPTSTPPWGIANKESCIQHYYNIQLCYYH